MVHRPKSKSPALPRHPALRSVATVPRPSLRFLVPEGGLRLDRLLADASGLGRRAVRAWLADGLVRVNGHVARPSDTPQVGWEVTVAAADPAPPAAELPSSIAVVLENERRVVLAKPAGLHCERGRSGGCVADLLEARYGDLSGVGEREAEAGLVHRLDRDTSGVLLAARDSEEYARLRRAFAGGDTRKEYLALVTGRVPRSLRIDTPLAHRGSHMAAATAHERALAARTWIEPLESAADWSLVLATMDSGAMHQVRVHLSLSGFPLVGDELYGGPVLEGCARRGQLLHAWRLQVRDILDVTVAPPADFVGALAMLRRGAGG